MIEQWEYFTCILNANAEKQKGWLDKNFPTLKLGKFAPQSLIPILNDYGALGWELITFHPYTFGDNQDVMTQTVSGAGTWAGKQYTSMYLCAFKRRKQP